VTRVAVFVLLFAAGLLRSQDPPPRGKKLFETHCALCHGATGAGGRGPDLARPALPRAPDDESLRKIIAEGIPGTEMPQFWQLSPGEAGDLAAYVRSLGQIAIVPLPGDAERGRLLYEKSGCSACHIVRGAGNGLGPELTDAGARRNPDYLRESIVKPAASVPPQFLVVTVATRTGPAIRGLRVNEDTFTIQLRDAAGRFYSFRKAALVNLKKETDATLMPSYELKFSSAELDDLVAFLASLRGEL